MVKERLELNTDRFFDPNPEVRKIARELYESVKDAPIISPHGHVNPELFAEGPDVRFGNPTELLIIPDHYLFRMLYSQGISMESLGIHRVDGSKIKTDPKKIWQIFAENFYLLRGTPTGIWLDYEFKEVFGIEYKLTKETAMEIYETINKKLDSPEFSPRKLFDRFKIEVLATTNSATSDLAHHKAIRNSGWKRRIIPTFRPDSVIKLGRLLRLTFPFSFNFCYNYIIWNTFLA